MVLADTAIASDFRSFGVLAVLALLVRYAHVASQ